MRNSRAAHAAYGGAYPERPDERATRLDRLARSASGPLWRALRGRQWRWQQLAERVAGHGDWLEGFGPRALAGAAAELRVRLSRQGFEPELVARAFALVREAAWRTIGQRHFDVQLVGGWALLHGMVAEMETGEGKTLTATLPACTAALAGVPVHVVTVNDYLATRDAAEMGPVYRELGLTVGVVRHGLSAEERRAAYACDVTYCTNKEVAFDYLKDRIVLGRQPNRIQLAFERLYGGESRARRLIHRGLHYAIVDEADSVLVDEARTPLIISGAAGESPAQSTYEKALALASALEAGRHFAVNERERAAELTPAGEARLGELAAPFGGVWTGRQRRRDLVQQALAAQHLIQRDRHYLVRDGKVQIIDEYTGRLMPDRSWEHDLHQMLEVKEGCRVTGAQTPLARMSYQRFFRRYVRLAGMTGTAGEIAGELWSVYGLAVVTVPTRLPMRRRAVGDRVYATREARWDAVVARVAELHREARPVLVGTRSVEASDDLGRRLAAAGLPHRVLSARQDREEADVVARAGEPGRITVATNMAGRGTDIRLTPGVAEQGGLHVIATERHESARIDRQLFGRCGRQGDPGSYEAIVSLEDELIAVHARALWRWLGRALTPSGRPVPAWVGRAAVRSAQRAAERLHKRIRRGVLRLDEQLQTMLAFSGRIE